MTTRVIGIKEFRQQLTKLSKQKNMRFIVMHHSVPIMKVELIDEDELILEKFAEQIQRGLRDYEAGRTISSKTLRKRLKL